MLSIQGTNLLPDFQSNPGRRRVSIVDRLATKELDVLDP